MGDDGFDSDDTLNFDGVQAETRDSNREVTDAMRAFNERADKERGDFLDVTDSEFWFAVCFQTREQKEEFLAKMGWLDEGDKYLDGTELAKLQKIVFENATPKARSTKINKRWLEFSKEH